jgi:hypothetical protein
MARTAPNIGCCAMNIVYYILFFSICTVSFSCGVQYDEKYYEKASGIKLPDSVQPIESFDNGEFYTVTSFKLSADGMHTLVNQYPFEGIKPNFRPTVFGTNNLKRERPEEKHLRNYVYIMRSNGKLHSTYLADTVRRLLWASISYPAWGGN